MYSLTLKRKAETLSGQRPVKLAKIELYDNNVTIKVKRSSRGFEILLQEDCDPTTDAVGSPVELSDSNPLSGSPDHLEDEEDEEDQEGDDATVVLHSANDCVYTFHCENCTDSHCTQCLYSSPGLYKRHQCCECASAENRINIQFLVGLLTPVGTTLRTNDGLHKARIACTLGNYGVEVDEEDRTVLYPCICRWLREVYKSCPEDPFSLLEYERHTKWENLKGAIINYFCC